MNEHHLKIYLQELLNQVESVRLAVNSYNQALTNINATTVPTAFAAAQSFLSAIAMISKLLWPSPMPTTHVNGTPLTAQEKRQAKARTNLRGETLRNELGNAVIDGLTILKTREVRNGLEHFDERLDQYLFEAGEGANIIDRNIISPGNIVINGNSEPLTLRNINPHEHIVSVLGDRANMQELMSAVDQLSQLCDDRLARAG